MVVKSETLMPPDYLLIYMRSKISGTVRDIED